MLIIELLVLLIIGIAEGVALVKWWLRRREKKNLYKLRDRADLLRDTIPRRSDETAATAWKKDADEWLGQAKKFFRGYGPQAYRYFEQDGGSPDLPEDTATHLDGYRPSVAYDTLMEFGIRYSRLRFIMERRSDYLD